VSERAAEDDRSPPTGRRAWWRRLGPAQLATLIALVASGVALVFTLWPGLKPDPRDRIAGTIAVFAVDREVTLGQWIDRTTFSADDCRRAIRASSASRGELATQGEVAYVTSRIEGFKRRSATLRWTVYESKSQRPLIAEGLSGVESARISLEAPADASVQEVWLPPPPTHGMRYFVRFALYDGNDTLLAVADSKPFLGVDPTARRGPVLPTRCRTP
jgi:hypothetical protein